MTDEAPDNVTELPSKNLTDQILEADDIEEELVPMPEWGEGVSVLVMSMTSDERGAILKDALDLSGDVPRLNFRESMADIIIATAHHPETRERLFTTEHRDRLGHKNAALIDRLAGVGMRLSALTDVAGAAAGKG